MSSNFLDYGQKPHCYFSGVRKPFIYELPLNPSARLLEVGCGTGETARYALEQGKCGWCCGIEVEPQAAEDAKTKLHRVIVGDIEHIELDFTKEYFDILILGEVLEHLVDPWSVLKKLYYFLKPGGLVRAGSPNIGHWSTLLMLVRGRWDYTSAGIMDITHLRWFTPATYKELFESCGYIVDSVMPVFPLRPKARLFNILTSGRLRHLLHSQIDLKARRPSRPEHYAG